MATVLVPFQPAEPAQNGQQRPDSRAEKIEITPEMAREWMARHREVVAAHRVAGMGRARDNRRIRRKDVTGWGRDMRAGKWRLNGETIKRGWDETIVDGQHRLLACIEAEVPFWSFVVTGVDPDDQDTVDIGPRRTMSDQLAIAGEKNTAVLASVARWSLRWLHGVRGASSGSSIFTPTNTELLEYLEVTPHLRDAAAFGMRAYGQFEFVRPSVYAIAWIVFNGINPIAAQVFLEGVTGGASLPKGHPALGLRDRMIRARDERMSEQEQFALMIAAWNAFRDERPLSRPQLPAGSLVKNFPEPK